MKASKLLMSMAVAGILSGAGAFAEGTSDKDGKSCAKGAACGKKDCKCKDKKTCKCDHDKNKCSGPNGCHEKSDEVKPEASSADEKK